MNQKTIARARTGLLITLVSVAVMSLSLSFISLTLGMTDAQARPLSYTIAVLFWLGLLGAIVTPFFTKTVLKKARMRLIGEKKLSANSLPGIIRFSKQKQNLVLYAIILIGLAFIISDLIIGYVPSALMFPILSVTILAFAVHCIVDGKYFKTYQTLKESEKNASKH